MSKHKHQIEDMDKHPQQYQRDLSPNAMAGQNIASAGAHPEKSARTAYDIKPVHAKLRHLLDDDLKQIPVMPTGARLEQGATYFDLNHPERGEITATGEMVAEEDNWYVPKSEVHYNLWNLLIGVDNPERLGTTRVR
ncbi:MAG TPA: hypothetical protein VNN73_06165 [Blastocatellia bacterium]|nr:hypothetical protein [Blastocatellia bacterium]